MASSWGSSWGTSWGNSWGATGTAPATSPIVGGTYSGFTTLGVVTVGISPVTLSGTSGKTVATIEFCTHESNGANNIIYIGDLTMTSSARAIVSLKGPNVVHKFENFSALNTIPLSNITLLSNAADQKVRISVLVS